MSADEILMDAEERMEKAIAHLGDSLSGIHQDFIGRDIFVPGGKT